MGTSEKYNFPIGDKPGGNVGLIMSHIDKHQLVLECGCASGYMTEYLATRLYCPVHIVEIDPECYKKAQEFALDGYCGDLEEDGWVNHLWKYKYNRILFADVLEHLRNPQEVLRKAVTLLQDDGKVIISIPNVCHNDILVKMFYDHWQYTGLGLLDETHIHFWGLGEIAPFIYEAGLAIDSYEAVCMPTQHTEQRMPFKVDDELMKLLKKRQYGEVYQWVLTCSKRFD